MTGQEFETPKCLEKRARLESFPITSLENEETNQQNFEYIPDSDALQKTCLSPCGKASLTSAVVGSPVAGKTSAGTMNGTIKESKTPIRRIFYVMPYLYHLLSNV